MTDSTEVKDDVERIDFTKLKNMVDDVSALHESLYMDKVKSSGIKLRKKLNDISNMCKAMRVEALEFKKTLPIVKRIKKVVDKE